MQRLPAARSLALGVGLVAALLIAGVIVLRAPRSGGGSNGCRVPDAADEARPAQDRSQPNIVMIVTDDQRWDTLDVMPNVRSLLADHGVTFTNAFATTPLCCPSRASILTGEYARHTGVVDNVGPGGGALAFDDASTVATWLDAAGYRTALVGKYLNGYRELGRCYVPPGWDEWDAIAEFPSLHYYDLTLNVNRRLVRYGDAPRDHQTSVLFRRAEELVRRSASPFFLYLAPSAPHLPAIPLPRDEGSYADIAPWRPVSYLEPDRADKPWDRFIDPLAEGRAVQLDIDRQHMLESLRSLDRWIGELVRALEETGRLDDTVIVFTSDNGFLWGEHGLISKTWPYDESIRVPLVIRTPWASEPRRDDRLVLNIDLASTVAELAGAAPGTPQDGRSLVPLLRGERVSDWREDFVVEWLGRDLTPTRLGPRPYRGLRSERYLYLEYDNGWVELYDLVRDPLELENLAGSRPDLVVRMADRLAELEAA